MGGGALMTPVLVLLFHVQPVAAVASDLDDAQGDRHRPDPGLEVQGPHPVRHADARWIPASRQSNDQERFWARMNTLGTPGTHINVVIQSCT